MIYSASRRTDLVAFYPDFITAKIARSRKLQALVLWTKDPRNCVNHPGLREALAKYPVIMQLTVTGLGGTYWEPNVPEPGEISAAIRQLGKMLPPGAISWRFDPIIADESLHARFSSVLKLLRDNLPLLDGVTVSFPAPYRKVTERLAQDGRELPRLSAERRERIIRELQELSPRPLEFRACCQPDLLGIPGVKKAACVDGEMFDSLYGTAFGKLEKDFGQRRECGCGQSTDIGDYSQLCRHNCRYCYARPES
jgi:hypothetical protein